MATRQQRTHVLLVKRFDECLASGFEVINVSGAGGGDDQHRDRGKC